MDFDVVSRFVFVLTSLFVVVDPIGVVPSFIALTQSESTSEVNRLARRSSLIGGAILIFFALLGTWLFELLGLEVNALKAAGGLLLLLTALEMMRAKHSSCKCSPEELAARKEHEDISVVPLAIPLLAGPGAISSVMIFSSDHETSHILHFAVILAAILFTFAISYFVLRSSSFVKSWLGNSGISVVQRVMGLVLAALAIQMLLAGGADLINRRFKSNTTQSALKDLVPDAVRV